MNNAPKGALWVSRGVAESAVLYALDCGVVHRVSLLFLGQLVVTQRIGELACRFIDACNVVVRACTYGGRRRTARQGDRLTVGPDRFSGVAGLLIGKAEVAVGFAEGVVQID